MARRAANNETQAPAAARLRLCQRHHRHRHMPRLQLRLRHRHASRPHRRQHGTQREASPARPSQARQVAREAHPSQLFGPADCCACEASSRTSRASCLQRERPATRAGSQLFGPALGGAGRLLRVHCCACEPVVCNGSDPPPVRGASRPALPTVARARQVQRRTLTSSQTARQTHPASQLRHQRWRPASHHQS
jgi:hypothetical protein